MLFRSPMSLYGEITNIPDEYKQEMINRGTLGIGMIHRNNEFEVKNLMQVAYYLVNPEKLYQHPVVKIGNMRTFGKGEFRVKWRRGIK